MKNTLRRVEQVCQACGAAITGPAVRVAYGTVRGATFRARVAADYFHAACPVAIQGAP